VRTEITDIFGPKGTLSSHLPEYQLRPAQLEMAQVVEEIIADNQDHFEAVEAACLVVEAETGLGKTLAYLIPAVLSGRKVIVSTNTRNLQDQIIKREVPFIRKYIDPELKAACIKGKQNYLCLHRFYQLQAAKQEQLFDKSAMESITSWLENTCFGDRSELGWITDNSSLWQKICCQSHLCLGSDCPHATDCFLNTLRKEAAACRLLIVNHHLLFSDLSVRRTGYGEVLPRYQTVIFDEAHHLEDIASTFFGYTFSKFQVIDLVGDIERSALNSLVDAKQESVIAGVRSLRSRVEQFAAFFPEERGRFPLDGLIENRPGLSKSRDLLLSGFIKLIEVLDGLNNSDEPWDNYGDRCHELQGRLESITSERFDDGGDGQFRYVHWFERSAKNLALSATPIDVAPDIQEYLLSSVESCVFTSATLGIRGNFDYFISRLGLPKATKTYSFPSPFDYAHQTLLYIPDNKCPEPNTTGHSAWLSNEIARLINLSRGRALVLFTSIQAMEATFYELRDTLKQQLLIQGSAPRHELLCKFTDDTESVLFAVSSFWEGVDIPGETLSLVIIDKIPFEVPSDPVIMARMNQIRTSGSNPFFEFQVPRAIMSLRQGAGRLMRAADDRGVIAILDVRLFSKGYGRRFLDSLPPSPLCRDLEKVGSFFAI